jgi:multicomponent K+:H+ antiporter subunit D
MSHWIIVPIVLPAVSAALLLLAAGRPMPVQRWLSATATTGLAAVCAGLSASLDDFPQAYLLGNWPAPFGIVLVLDRLSALMLTLTAGVALGCLAYAMTGWDAAGPAGGKRYFHALFQFQLMGLNGAFLTGDLFNLFVFFEVLLIASYGLLVHGGGADRARAGIHYVVVNLTASALFLVGVALLYGAAGTLNMADLARTVGRLEGEAALLARVAGLLLLVVFAVKAALFPLYFWLPISYTAAAAPVAALFALMTKVGVYAILRMFTLVFGQQGTDGLAAPWVLPAGLITLGLGTLGVLAASDLGRLVAYLTLASVGTLLAAVGLFTPQAIASALFYLVHSTLVTAGLFLLWERIALERGGAADRFQRGPRLGRPLLLAGAYAFLAASAVGLPPFSGFLGKVMILESARQADAALSVWSVVLITGLFALFAVARAGSRLFWDLSRESPPAPQAASPAQALPLLALMAGLTALVVLAAPFKAFTDRTAQALFDVERYTAAVLSHRALPQRGLPGDPPEETSQ